MAKKSTPVKPESTSATQNLVDAIVTVKHLQEYIQQHGGLENALAAIERVHKLVSLTGTFERLTEALEIVGRPIPPEGSS
jgi:hypothetical protein